MELNINSPGYFKDFYGVDDEVYKFCQKVHLFFLDKEYSTILHTIGIALVAAPQELYDSGLWKENVQLINNKSCASIFMRMNFVEYYNANSFEKILLTKKTVLKAVKRIKSKVKFDYETFERDFNLL